MVVARRRQRRPLVVAGLVISALVVLVNAAISARSSGPSRRLAELSYLDRVRPQVQVSIEEGADLADVRARAVTLGRAGITHRMDRLAGDAESVARVLVAIEPPKALRVAHAFLLATVAIRARVATSIRGALSAALGTAPLDASVAALAAAGRDLSAADQDYEHFLGELPAAVRSQSALPPSRWVSDAQMWDRVEVASFVASLRSSSTLAAVHDVALVFVATDPIPVGTDGTAWVLPATAGLTLRLVVANVGNEPERHVVVVAELDGPGHPREMVRDFVDLAPGQRRALTLGRLRPAPGPPYNLVVKVGPVDGESELADNARSLILELR